VGFLQTMISLQAPAWESLYEAVRSYAPNAMPGADGQRLTPAIVPKVASARNYPGAMPVLRFAEFGGRRKVQEWAKCGRWDARRVGRRFPQVLKKKTPTPKGFACPKTPAGTGQPNTASFSQLKSQPAAPGEPSRYLRPPEPVEPSSSQSFRKSRPQAKAPTELAPEILPAGPLPFRGTYFQGTPIPPPSIRHSLANLKPLRWEKATISYCPDLPVPPVDWSMDGPLSPAESTKNFRPVSVVEQLSRKSPSRESCQVGPPSPAGARQVSVH
jgi:hypothetical protein